MLVITKRCNCKPAQMHRVKRVSLLERTVYRWMGLYPWRCRHCTKRMYLFRRKADPQMVVPED